VANEYDLVKNFIWIVCIR